MQELSVNLRLSNPVRVAPPQTPVPFARSRRSNALASFIQSALGRPEARQGEWHALL